MSFTTYRKSERSGWGQGMMTEVIVSTSGRTRMIRLARWLHEASQLGLVFTGNINKADQQSVSCGRDLLREGE